MKLNKQVVKSIALPKIINEHCHGASCFVAGTLVHTNQGLVPIEQIKVGDLVLSRHEDGDDSFPTEYKQVTKTFKSTDKKDIFSLKFVSEHSNDETGVIEYLFSTSNHPYWKQNSGWENADHLCMGDQLTDLNGDIIYVYDDVLPILLFPKLNGIGFTKYSENHPVSGREYPRISVVDFNRMPKLIYTDDKFYDDNFYYEDKGLWNVNNNTFYSKDIVNDVMEYYLEQENLFACSHNKDYLESHYKDYIYNIEVDNYHTYFVGKVGVWVHDAN